MQLWSQDSPIYRQIRDKIVSMLMDKVLKEGEPLPSVRKCALDWRVNHLTVLKGFHELVQEEIVEKRRGKTFHIVDGALKKILKIEKNKFINDEWPKLKIKIKQLGLEKFISKSL